MSCYIKNILYVGNNIQLAETMLDLTCAADAQSSGAIVHLSRIDGIESALAEKKITHLICERPVSKALKAKIGINFPLLKTTYLPTIETSRKIKASSANETLITTEQIQAVLDHLRLPIYFKNKQGEYIACNACFSVLFGLIPEQVIGKKASDLCPEGNIEKLKKLAEVDEQVFSESQAYIHQIDFKDINGVAREVLLRKQCIDSGEIQVGIVFDVSEINHTKALLEKERLRLRATADISSDLIFFKDIEGRFTGCNKQFELFVGCSEKEIVGKKCEQIFKRDQVLMCQAQDIEAMSNNEICSKNEYLTSHNGERHFIEMKKVPLQDENGKVQGLIGVGRDISVQQLLLKRLKVANAVFENNKENIFITDQLGNIVAVNKTCCSTSGYSESELINLNLREVASNQHENIEIALKENKKWQGDLTYFSKSGSAHFAWLEAYVVEDSDQYLNSRIYTFTDIKQIKNFEDKMQFFSKNDPLTGLFNRIALFSRMEDAINRAIYLETIMAVLLVDIKGIKGINKQYGHNAGDQVLKEIAERLKNCVLEQETVARFSDDQFVIIINELLNEEGASRAAEKIAGQLNKKFNLENIENIEIDISVTIGISLSPDDGMDINALLVNAEEAMKRGRSHYRHAKANSDKASPSMHAASQSNYHFYTRKLTHNARRQTKQQETLSQALHLDQFELYYQPQYDLSKQQIVAVEGFPCWHHPEQGTLLPDHFLISVEKSGLLVPLGLKLLRKAAQQAATWHQSAINFGRVAIDIEVEQLSQASFIADLQTILKETGCSSQWLEFQIKEAVFESDSMVIHENLLNISKLGIALTLDDFAANNPLFYLFEQLQIEKIKISKNHTQGGSGPLIAAAVTQSVTLFANLLGIDVVSKGTENAWQDKCPTSALRGMGQANLQGKPMKALEATFYLRCNKRK